MTVEDLKELKKNYIQTFSTPEGQKVLEDLRKRFYWNESTFSVEQGETYLNEGGRRVLLTIENIMKLTVDELKGGEDNG